jgi:hypothetical protein
MDGDTKEDAIRRIVEMTEEEAERLLTFLREDDQSLPAGRG